MQTAFEEVVGIPFIYMQVAQCKKRMVLNVMWTFGQFQHVLAFWLKLGGWQMAK